LLIENGSDIPPERLIGARRIGLTAGASAPEQLVEGVVQALAGLGPAEVGERSVATEEIRFRLPPEVRRGTTPNPEVG
jgi:4-hydroxy-3-methylbut-2-enyl diphosphate reductase